MQLCNFFLFKNQARPENLVRQLQLVMQLYKDDEKQRIVR